MWFSAAGAAACGHVVEAVGQAVADFIDRPPDHLFHVEGEGGEDALRLVDDMRGVHATVGHALVLAQPVEFDIEPHQMPALARQDHQRALILRAHEGFHPPVGEIGDGQQVDHPSGVVGGVAVQGAADGAAHVRAGAVAADDIIGADDFGFALAARRGVFQLGPLRIVTGDPFGLFQAERKISAVSPLVVYPQTVDIPEFVLPVGMLPGGDALRRRAHHVTTNAAGVRDYASGDSFSRIHWRSTARKNRLIVKEFELDPLADVWVMMDGERTVHVGDYELVQDDFIQLLAEQQTIAIPPTTEEYTVTIAASLATHFVQRDRAVGFVTQGRRREVIHADRGTRQLTKILEALAVSEARGAVTFGQLMSAFANQLPRGTTVVLVTPSTRDDWVMAAHSYVRRGLRAVAVLIDGQSFGGRPGAHQVAVRLSLIQVPTYIVQRGDDLQLALSRPRI